MSYTSVWDFAKLRLGMNHANTALSMYVKHYVDLHAKNMNISNQFICENQI